MATEAHGRERLAALGLQGGFLYTLPEDATDRLLDRALRITVPAGVCLYRGDERPRVIVVLTGLLRVFLTSVEGRQVTIRYARSGDVVGLMLVLGGPVPMSIEALTSASVLALRADTLRRALGSDALLARSCAQELGRQLRHAFEDLAAQAFLPLRQRIIIQLLALATPGRGRHLVVHASHEELAETVASVREVVTRTLDQLRREGLIETERDEIVLLDPVRLSQEIGSGAEARA
ncbi:MAG: Crp/Fnr family transcriptional regulator [Candidatus Limnocylindrales bacterium]|jgi:CRP/FNR family transcriptional regulator